MADRVTFLVELEAKPDSRETFERLLLDVLDHVSREKDFELCHVHRSQDNPNLLVLHETWSCSRQYFLEHYLKAPYKKEYEEAVPWLLARPMSIQFLNAVVSIPKQL
jgi:quinol monooxygenase YgiN